MANLLTNYLAMIPIFLERYTMDAERLVHRDTLEQTGFQATEQAGSQDGLEDNIEFF